MTISKVEAMMNEKESGRTKFRIIAETLEKEIRGGKYAGTTRSFPSARSLAMRFGVARVTVTSVLQLLRERGLLTPRQGKGTFLTQAARTRGGAIGLFMPVSHCDIFVPICQEIVRLAQDAGYTFMMADMTTMPPAERAARAVKIAGDFAAAGVRGVIFHPLQDIDCSRETNETLLTIFHDAGIPVVLADCDTVPDPERSGYDVVGIDNTNAGWRMTRHLHDLGARHIAFLTHATLGASHRDRAAGYQAAMRALGLEKRIDLVRVPPADAVALKRHFRTHGFPDAVICSNDRMAMNFHAAMRTLGKTAPDDFLLAGFDDSELARAMTPQLTTVRQPCTEIAQTAFALLRARMENPEAPTRRVSLDAPIIPRASTKEGGI